MFGHITTWHFSFICSLCIWALDCLCLEIFFLKLACCLHVSSPTPYTSPLTHYFAQWTPWVFNNVVFVFLKYLQPKLFPLKKIHGYSSKKYLTCLSSQHLGLSTSTLTYLRCKNRKKQTMLWYCLIFHLQKKFNLNNRYSFK